jgi:eukaryotic-like serine/threonine-protein kinase
LVTDHQRRVRELFDAALDQPAGLRHQFLAEACHGDQQLLETVGRLLRAKERSDGVLDTPVAHRREAAPSPAAPGSFIGPYKILQELGGGGMGIVYQAIRADEVFQRVCAIKVIRPDLSTGRLLDRFRQERQILARLDHPNIARIVDGGSTKDSLPYFVMDFVDGPSIGNFCSEHGLGIRARLALFQQVCAAVQYLHQSGVIHGDLKPPNILVGNDGAVKLVDFGIASALSNAQGQQRDSALSLMTPGYASPEQMRGQPLTPASDVYSLGVILYELLTGNQPYPAANRSRSEILNAIATQDPSAPSTKTVGQIHAELQGDLDRIVLYALHREPGHRYRSAAELSSDIGRYLDHRPVAASNGSLLYKTRKFLIRNNRTAQATFIALVLLGTTSWQGVVAYKRLQYSHQLERRLHREQDEIAERTNERKAELVKSAAAGKAPNSPELKQLQESELRDVKQLTDSYRTSFSEAVRVWPGMTRSRRQLLDQAGTYLHEVEPYVRQDPRAPEQLASAWLWLANIEGNPQTVNLRDHKRATASIHQAQQLLDKAPTAPLALVQQVQAAAKQIAAGGN